MLRGGTVAAPGRCEAWGFHGGRFTPAPSVIGWGKGPPSDDSFPCQVDHRWIWLTTSDHARRLGFSVRVTRITDKAPIKVIDGMWSSGLVLRASPALCPACFAGSTGLQGSAQARQEGYRQPLWGDRPGREAWRWLTRDLSRSVSNPTPRAGMVSRRGHCSVAEHRSVPFLSMGNGNALAVRWGFRAGIHAHLRIGRFEAIKNEPGARAPARAASGPF
jgi:hypothetical protein